MSSAQDTGHSSTRSEDSKKVLQAINALNTDDKLAWFYYVYEKMGDSITPAAPNSANLEITPKLLGDFYELSHDQQLAIMREIVNREDTEFSRYYGGLAVNNQLVVWYAWAKAMGNTVVDIPQDYKANQAINDALSQVEGLDFEEQISLFRDVVGNMGYSDVGSIPTQAETGKTPSL